MRVFVRWDGSAEAQQALESARLRFSSDVLRKSEVVFAGSGEQDVIYAECRESIGVEQGVERECQLKAARRENIAQLLELGMRPSTQGRWELSLRVWDPDDNAEIHSELVEIEGESAEQGARAGLTLLAASYLDFLCRKGLAAARCEQLAKGSAKLEIVAVEPSPARVFIDDIELEGSAPGLFEGLPKGKHALTVSVDGYQDYSRQLEFSNGRTVSIASIQLEPMPARVSLQVNLPEAIIRLDGQKVGKSSLEKTFTMVVLAGNYQLSVELDGYQPYLEQVELAPGAELSRNVTLLLAEPEPIDEPDPEPDQPPQFDCSEYACIAHVLPECVEQQFDVDCPELLKGELAKVYLQERIDANGGDFERAWAEAPGGLRDLVEQRLSNDHFLLALAIAGGYGNLTDEGGQGLFRLEGRIGQLWNLGAWKQRFEGSSPGWWLGFHAFGGADNFDTLFGGLALRTQFRSVPSVYFDLGGELSYATSTERMGVGPRVELGLDLENLAGVYVSGDVLFDEDGTRFAAMLGLSFSWQLGELLYLVL
jgi:hypothetical protein